MIRLTPAQARRLGIGATPTRARHVAASNATFRCHSCGARTTTLAGAERHADTVGHRRIEVGW